MRCLKSLAVAVVLFAGIAFPSPIFAGELPVPPAQDDSLHKFLPYLIGGTIAVGMMAILALVAVANKKTQNLPTNDPNSLRLPDEFQTEGNPLRRLAVPAMVVIGVAVGLYLVLGEVNDPVQAAKSAVNAPAVMPKVEPIVTPTVDPKTLQPAFPQAPNVQPQGNIQVQPYVPTVEPNR